MTESAALKWAVMVIIGAIASWRLGIAVQKDAWLKREPTNPDWDEKWVY